MKKCIYTLNGLLFLLLLVLNGRIDSFPYGVEQLSGNKRTVTIYYDIHEESPHTTVDEMQSLPFKKAKKKLYPSEQRFLTQLERLNESDNTALVWEFRRDGRPSGPYFLGLAPEWIKTNFTNIHFMHADNNRVSFRSNFVSNEPNLTAATFNNPMPLSKKLQKAIRQNYGDTIWHSYKRSYMKVKRKLYEDYREVVFFDTSDFWPTASYDKIADLEMLAHILASDKQNILVYCGGSHAARIANFLKTHADFKVIKKQGCKEMTEIAPRMLDFLF